MNNVIVVVPVYNEAKYLERVLRGIRSYAPDVLAIDDGSTDGSGALLDRVAPSMGVNVLRHPTNLGYGRSLRDGFAWAQANGFDWTVTIDCDEQHEPAAIPRFIDALTTDSFDVISGSRYLDPDAMVDAPPPERRRVNMTITAELNDRIAPLIGGPITDSFCGFKAVRTSAAAEMSLDEDGYAMPMQFWVRAAAARLRVGEIPVKLIYNDPSRTFGGELDDTARRLAHYREVLHRELCRCAEQLPGPATSELVVECR
ncbi:MAG: glycosyltransferase family 2 protein [Planctomycetota bacterium]